jgi:AraC-like DNA-binding protein
MFYEYELISHFEGTGLKAFMVSINRRLFHWHYDFELLLVVEGSIILKTSKEEFLLHQNDIFLLNRYELHSLFQTREKNTILAIQFNPKFCKGHYPELQQTQFQDKLLSKNNHLEHWHNIQQYVIEIILNCYKNDKYVQFKVVSSLNSLIYSLLKNFKTRLLSEDYLQSEEKNLLRISRIIDYIQENFMNKVTLKDIAKKENLDMYYLSHFIKDTMGISFQQYLNKVRLQRAFQLITDKDMKKIDICMECGFSDYRYLVETFKKEYGCHPDDYKQTSFDLFNNQSSNIDHEQHNILAQKNAIKKLLSYQKLK